MPSNNTIKMCAAGSGKTWGICNDALSVVSEAQGKRALITTYTNKGVETVNNEIAKQNLGVTSSKIVVRSWFQFLMSELIRPFQSYITSINTLKSFDFSDRYGKINFAPKGTPRRYISGRYYVMKDFASELAVCLNELSRGAVISRLEKVYSHIFIDEFQDMAGYDLNIVALLFASNIEVVCVGDNKQATYTTHNTRKNKAKSGVNLWDFCSDTKKCGMAAIEESFVSRRFNSNICAFANTVFSNDNNISTCMCEKTEHDGVYIIKQCDMKAYYDYFSPVVLKYDVRTEVGAFNSLNFGQCKGMTFERVLIFPNKPLVDFIYGKNLSSPQKYYVAVTRPMYSLAIVMDNLPRSDKLETVEITLGQTTIIALHFIAGASGADLSLERV